MKPIIQWAAMCAFVVRCHLLTLPLPPMGFNNWARFTTNNSESIFVEAAEAMSRNGLLAAGYNRLNLDDAWSTMARAQNGSMVWDPVKFPRGLPWLTEHVRSKGFIPGIYTDAGSASCAGYPGSLGHEETDVADFRAWGFEYLKLDGCHLPPGSEVTYREVYGRWATVMAETGESMVFAVSAPAYLSDRDKLADFYAGMLWASLYGNVARHSADVATHARGDGWRSIMANYDHHVGLARFQRPGYFNDADLLIPDQWSLSMDEKKSQFALWCTFSAPLLLSADIPSLSDEVLAIFTNERLIAVNQDPLVQQGTLVRRSYYWDILAKNLDNGDRLVTILNRGAFADSVHVSWEEVGFFSLANAAAAAVHVTDLWSGQNESIPVSAGGITRNGVPSHGTAVLRIAKTTPGSPFRPTGIILNTASRRCLTDSPSGSITWAECEESHAQVWTVSARGRIRSLSRPDKCVVDEGGRVRSRSDGCDVHAWNYHISGNLVNGASWRCLTESPDGSALAEPCGHLLDEQVVALPAGVELVGLLVSERQRD